MLVSLLRFDTTTIDTDFVAFAFFVTASWLCPRTMVWGGLLVANGAEPTRYPYMVVIDAKWERTATVCHIWTWSIFLGVKHPPPPHLFAG